MTLSVSCYVDQTNEYVNRLVLKPLPLYQYAMYNGISGIEAILCKTGREHVSQSCFDILDNIVTKYI